MADTVLDFNTASETDLGSIVRDGQGGSADIADRVIELFVSDTSAASPVTNLGYYSGLGDGSQDGLVSASGGDLSFVIRSQDDSEFAFKGLYLYAYLGGTFQAKIEGFRDGQSTGFITANFSDAGPVYGVTLTSAELTPGTFQNVDEVRITDMAGGELWLAYDQFVIGDAVDPNTVPTATNLTQTVAYTEDPGGAVALPDIVVTDPDAGETITATLTLSSAAAGSLSTGTFGSATSTYTAGTGVWTVTGSVADVNAALAAVSFTPATSWDKDVTLTTHIEDAAGAGPADGAITLDVTPVNDAPTATNLTQSKAVTEAGSATALDDIVVTDVDTGEAITATLTLSSAGAGALSTGTFGAATSTYNAGTGVWTVTGSAADVNAALAAVALTPSANNDQDFTIATRIRDAAGTGPADGTISVAVTAVNDAPTATNLTQTVAYTEDPGGAVALPDIVVSDADTGEAITATLTLSSTAAGSLSTGTYGSATSTYDAGTGVWTVTGSVADVNAALAAVSFTPASNWDQDVTIATHVEDAAGAGPADGTITLDVTPVNDAPTATNLTQSKAAVEGGSAVALDDIVVSDIDTGEQITATLTLSSAGAGALSTGTFGSATSTYNAGTGVWTVTGSVADVNAALAAVALTPSADNDQDFTIATRIYDSAWSGPADGTISVAVTAVNDAPTVSAAPSLTLTEDQPRALTAADFNFADVDGDALASVTVVALPGAGTLTLDGAAVSAGQTIDRADLDAGKLVFTPTADGAGAGYASFTFTVSDGTASSAQATAAFNVTAVNDAPTTDAAKGYVNAGAATETGGLVVIDAAKLNEGDVDDAGSGVSYTVTAATAAGTLFLDTNGNGVVDGGEALAAADTFTQADIDAGRLKYLHGGGAGAADSFTFSVADGGEDGAAALTGLTFGVSVAERPVVTIGAGSPAYAEDGAAVAIAPNLTLVDGDSADMSGATVTITDLVAGDVLGFTNQNGITGSFDAGAGVLTLSGTATRAQYEAALRSVTFGSSSENPATGAGAGDRVISFQVRDGGLASVAENVTVAVSNANDAPTATNLTQTVAYTEDPGSPVALGDIVVSDVDTGETITATLTLSEPLAGSLSTGTFGSATSTYTAGTGVWTVTGSVIDVNAALAAVSFTPDGNWDQDVTVATRIRDAADAGPADGTITLDVTPVNDPPTGAVTISGTATQGQTLTAAHTLADDDELGPVSYQWRADGTPIAGATGSTYTLAQAEVGKAITVVASYTDGAGNAESVASAATATVANVNDAPTGSVTISGSAQVGATLTAGNTLADLDGLGTITYQWRADGADLTGETGATLAVTSSLLGKTITVVARYTDGLGAAETVASAATSAVSDPPLPPPPPPPTSNETIDGVPVQTGTVTNPDGSTSQVITIPIVTSTRPEQVGDTTVADIPLVTGGSGPPPLLAQVPVGLGLQATGPGAPQPAGNSLADLIRAIQTHTAPGSTDQIQLTGGGSGFLQGLSPDAPLIVQTLTPTAPTGVAPPTAPLVISGAPIAPGTPNTALVIDTRSLPSGVTLQLDNVGFAAVVGAARVIGGEGSQRVWGDGANQSLFLGADDDELHGGGGADTVASAGGDDRLFGDDGDDAVSGGEGADQVWGGAGEDHVHGNVGDDFVHGGEGRDTLHGGQGHDVVRGGQGDDIALGDLGYDTLFGDLGADVLQGGAGDDVVWGGGGLVPGADAGDWIDGGEGSDFVHGNQGDDTVLGGLGADVVHGGQGADRLEGGDGADTLSGDQGDDVLIGGAGADRFLVFAGGGVDRILDFDVQEGDRLHLDAGLSYRLRQDGADTIVDLGGGQRVVLADVRLETLGDGWIVGG